MRNLSTISPHQPAQQEIVQTLQPQPAQQPTSQEIGPSSQSAVEQPAPQEIGPPPQSIAETPTIVSSRPRQPVSWDSEKAKFFAKNYSEYMKAQQLQIDYVTIDATQYIIWLDNKGFLGIQEKNSHKNSTQDNKITISDQTVLINGSEAKVVDSQFTPVLNCLLQFLTSIQPPSEHQGEQVLRKFDSLQASEISPDLIKRIRNIGRRRPEDWVTKDFTISSRMGESTIKAQSPLGMLRREAKFLGITEVEYKKILCEKDPSSTQKTDDNSKTSWQGQIDNEKQIATHLKTCWEQGSLSPQDAADLVNRLKNHPPLAKPRYFSQLDHLYKTVANLDQKKIILDAMKKTVDGVNSRRIKPFCNQALKEIQKRYPHEPNTYVQNILSGHVVEPKHIPSSPEEERSLIIQKIERDIQFIENVRRKKPNKTALLQTLKTEELPRYIQEQCEKIQKNGVAEFLQKSITQLKELKNTLKTFEGPNPRYYHATHLWDGVANDSILVAGGRHPELPMKRAQYAGAFFSKEGPLEKYGDVCFAFSDEIETTAKNVQTASSNNQYWYGFNRFIPVNAQAQVFKKQCHEKIFNSIKTPTNLSTVEQQAFKMGVMQWLENWTTTSYSEENGWKFAMRRPTTSEEKAGKDRFRPTQHLEIDTSVITQELQKVLTKAFPQCEEEIRRIQIPKLQDQKPTQSHEIEDTTGLRVVFVQDAQKIDMIRQGLLRRGIPDTVKVLPWDSGALWANYIETTVGVTHPLEMAAKSMGDKKKHIIPM